MYWCMGFKLKAVGKYAPMWKHATPFEFNTQVFLGLYSKPLPTSIRNMDLGPELSTRLKKISGFALPARAPRTEIIIAEGEGVRQRFSHVPVGGRVRTSDQQQNYFCRFSSLCFSQITTGILKFYIVKRSMLNKIGQSSLHFIPIWLVSTR